MEPRWILTRPERALTIVEIACFCFFFLILHLTYRRKRTSCGAAPHQIHPKNGWRAGEALEMFACVNTKMAARIFEIRILLVLINSWRDVKAEDPDGGRAPLSTSAHSSHSSEFPCHTEPGAKPFMSFCNDLCVSRVKVKTSYRSSRKWNIVFSSLSCSWF